MNGLEQDRALLQDLAAWASLSPSRLAAEAGLADTTITRSIKGTATTRLSQPTIDKLRTRFPDFPGWLKSYTSEGRTAFRGAEPERNPDMVEIAEIDPHFGMGSVFMDEHAVPNLRSFSRSWIRQFTDAPPDELYWAKPRGNSMAPTINDGEPVLIDRRQQTPRDADLIWAFAWGDIGAIKRLRPMPDGSIKILSDNPAVPPDVAYDGEVHIFGRVVAVVKRL